MYMWKAMKRSPLAGTRQVDAVKSCRYDKDSFDLHCQWWDHWQGHACVWSFSWGGGSKERVLTEHMSRLKGGCTVDGIVFLGGFWVREIDDYHQ
eukprot:scaffold60_cov325-Pavlova_lutheri.AAC.4